MTIKKLLLICLFLLPISLELAKAQTPKITVYTIKTCGRCSYTIKYLKDHNIPYTSCDLDKQDACVSAFWDRLFKEGLVKSGESFTTPGIEVDNKISVNIEDLEGFLDKIQGSGKDNDINEHKSHIVFTPNDKKNDNTPSETKPELVDFYKETPKEWTKAQKDAAFESANADYLQPEERKLIYLMNLARNNGALFVKTYVMPYVSKIHNNPDVNSLIADLNKVKNLPALKITHSLQMAAQYHAEDMGETGGVGHNSSDGTNCFDRISKYNEGGSMAENCSYGWEKALDILMQLLVDEGVPSKGHRKNILSRDYQYVGVFIAPHKEYGFNCVQDFSDIK